MLEGAQRYAQKGQYDKALKEYQKHLQGDPEDTNTRLKVGDIFLKLNDPQSAIEAYSQVAQQFSRSGFDAKAVAIYKQVLKVDAECLDARIKLGEHFQRMGLTSEALREMQDAFAICQKKGLKREGFNLLKRVAELDPENVPNRLSLADLLAREGLKDEARDEFTKLLDKAEADAAADLIVRVSEQMLAVCPDSERALLAFANAKVKVGMAKDAVAKLSAALPRFDESIAVREVLAAAHEAAGDKARMQSAYREIAELYKRRGDNEKARDILQRFVPVESFAGSGGPDTRNDVSFMDLRGEGVLDFGSDELGTGSVSASAVEPREPRKLAPQKPARPQPAAKAKPAPAPSAEGEGYDELIAQARMEREFGDPGEARRYAARALELEPNGRTAREILGRTEESPAGPLDEDDTGTLPDIELVLVDEEDDEVGFASVEPPPEIATPRAPLAPLEPELELEPAVAPARASAGAEEIEIDLDDLDLANADMGDFEADQRGREEVQLPDADPLAVDPPTQPPAPPSAPAAPPQAASASWAQQSSWVVKTVKAAEAILAKGMLDEAQMLYEQVLESAPHHPQALLRLGEIAARKGGDPLADEKSFEDTFVDRAESADDDSAKSGGSQRQAVSAKKSEPVPAAKPVPEIDLGGESFDALLASVDDEVRAAPAPAPAAAEEPDAFGDLFAEESSDDLAAIGDPDDLDVDAIVGADAPGALEDDIIGDDAELGVSAKRVRSSGESSTDVSVEADLSSSSASDDEDDVIVSDDTAKRPPAEAAPADVFDPSSLADDENDVIEEAAVAPDEDGFDLAAELEVGAAHPDGEEAPDFADIFRAFKKGIEEQVSAEDAAAHYDVAIAYKEMGLLGDAVEALEKVQKQGPLGVEGISLLATCKLEMGEPEAAIGLLVKALGKAATSGEKIALRYDLALAFSAAGQRDEALAAFQEVAKQDPSFREVQAQIEQLAG